MIPYRDVLTALGRSDVNAKNAHKVFRKGLEL
jgi:hypothetical protein